MNNMWFPRFILDLENLPESGDQGTAAEKRSITFRKINFFKSFRFPAIMPILQVGSVGTFQGRLSR